MSKTRLALILVVAVMLMTTTGSASADHMLIDAGLYHHFSVRKYHKETHVRF